MILSFNNYIRYIKRGITSSEGMNAAMKNDKPLRNDDAKKYQWWFIAVIEGVV